MPVVVQCFHCNAVLELDDGFRGGVCRCSACGSLLQVPKGEADAPPKAKRVRPAVPPGPTAPRPKSEDAGISSGALDPRRGDAGMSSGLVHKTSPIAMTAKPPAKPAAPGETPAPAPPALAAPAEKKARTPQDRGLLVVSFVMILLIAAVLAGAIVVYLRQNP
ncbi:MAG TPA: hypothetical protein VHM90_21285 [Phycisphaerae bacterium]|jgi:hypothetical protein|nr:hypothetical protein [Phycisphaerae bacterium]